MKAFEIFIITACLMSLNVQVKRAPKRKGLRLRNPPKRTAGRPQVKNPLRLVAAHGQLVQDALQLPDDLVPAAGEGKHNHHVLAWQLQTRFDQLGQPHLPPLVLKALETLGPEAVANFLSLLGTSHPYDGLNLGGFGGVGDEISTPPAT